MHSGLQRYTLHVRQPMRAFLFLQEAMLHRLRWLSSTSRSLWRVPPWRSNRKVSPDTCFADILLGDGCTAETLRAV